MANDTNNTPVQAPAWIAELTDALNTNHALRTAVGNLIRESITIGANSDGDFQAALQHALAPIVPSNLLTTANFGPLFYHSDEVFARIDQTTYAADEKVEHGG